MASSSNAKFAKVDATSPEGIISFPHLFRETASKKKDNSGNETGELVYDVQIIIPKTEREGLRTLLRAIKEVGESRWGDRWKSVKNPLRDGDREKDELAEDGSTKGEKYPERLGCYFLNARSSKPVGVFDRQRNVINDPNEVYGGCKGRISVTFYTYSTNGNHGIAAGLNGVQKTGDGEAFGGGAPAVESMFDLLDPEDTGDDLGLDDGLDDDLADEPEPTPAPKKTAAKKAPAKKAAAKKAAPAPEPEDLDDESDLDEPEPEGDDLLDDL